MLFIKFLKTNSFFKIKFDKIKKLSGKRRKSKQWIYTFLLGVLA